MNQPVSLAVIDEAIRRFAPRELVAAAEVVDVLLDLRKLLTHELEPAPVLVEAAS